MVLQPAASASTLGTFGSSPSSHIMLVINIFKTYVLFAQILEKSFILLNKNKVLHSAMSFCRFTVGHFYYL